MDATHILNELGVCSEEELQTLERLPEQHKGAIFTALDKHFAKYDDLLKHNSSIPSKEDL